MAMLCVVFLTGLAAAAGTAGAAAPAGLADDEQLAVRTVDAFWAAAFPTLFGRPYQAPKVLGGYSSVSDGPSCAGRPAEQMNAFYCVPGDFVAWDQNLMSSGDQRIGNPWVFFIIAHEWGHAIQARIDGTRVSQAYELQADCLAGAALNGALAMGLIRAEPTDAAKFGQALGAVGDSYPWTSTRDHGTAQQRTGAFALGVRGGVPACLHGG
jgi:hypothetical protein